MELHEGDKAPFYGQLLSPGLAAELSVGVERCEERRALESAHNERATKLAVSKATGPLEADKRAAEAKLEVVQAALDEALEQREIPFWEEPMVVGTTAFIAGVVVAGVLAYAGVWAVGQLRPAIPPAEPQAQTP